MGYLRFQESYIYQSFCIYNQKYDLVYNEMYTNNWWMKKQIELLDETLIIEFYIQVTRL